MNTGQPPRDRPSPLQVPPPTAPASVTLSPCHLVTLSPKPPKPPSSTRAWFYLVWLSWQRQARARQMVWIALLLLAFAVVWVAVQAQLGNWGMSHWRHPRRYG